MYGFFFKRLIDCLVATSIFILLFPVFVLLYIYLSFYYKGDPFFYQERPGYKAKVFSIIKFKSMVDAYDQDGKPLPDADRITNVGVFLRKTSLDELPQLINVIRGDMSFIGPRPLLVRYLPYYSEREQLRHQVRPGITGLAQVSGRNNLNWDERLEFDAYYAENISLALDLKILFTTVIKVLRGSDINIIPGEMLKPLDYYRQK